MPAKVRNWNISQIRQLFNKNGVCKENDEFVDALSIVVAVHNKNDKPFTVAQIKNQPELSDFNFMGKNDFVYVCNLKAEPIKIKDNDWINEKIFAVDFVNDTQKEIFNKHLGVTYMLTCKIENAEYIVKFGSSRTPFVKRLGSYNCGVLNNWRTASTTNIKILQSLVACRNATVFKLYLLPCGEAKSFTWHGVVSTKFSNSKELAYEDILVKKFKEQYGKLPLANIQGNATTVD
jgi:hypothetical protein